MTVQNMLVSPRSRRLVLLNLILALICWASSQTALGVPVPKGVCAAQVALCGEEAATFESGSECECYGLPFCNWSFDRYKHCRIWNRYCWTADQCGDGEEHCCTVYGGWFDVGCCT
jgi:hypothetical protein